MEKRLPKPDWLNERKSRARDEEELYSISYDDTSDLHPVSDISSFIKIPHRVRSSKENVELSLEVEIADSLKRLIASPRKNDSAILDVTIVRPSDLDGVRGALEAGNTLAFKNSEVRNLIASMERQKQHKRKLIEECKRKAASPKMIAISESQDAKSCNGSEHVNFPNEDDHKPTLQKRRLKRPETTKLARNNIAVMSAPTKQNARVTATGNLANTELFDYKGQHYRGSAPLSFIKPLVGDQNQSISNLEVGVIKVGDHQSVENITKRHEKYNPLSSTSDSNFSNTFLRCRDKKRVSGMQKKDQAPTHQIYATANHYNEKLKHLLSCQNAERNQEDNEKPCLCQHCGMIGLLVESQKRPVVPIPVKKQDSVRPRSGNAATNEHNNEISRKIRKDISESRPTALDLKTKCGGDHHWAIHDLSSRLEALEVRVTDQEQRAVPKDYFKRIINRILHRQNLSTQHMAHFDRDTHQTDRSTQYNQISLDTLPKKREPNKTIKHRNVQIQQNTRKGYCVNPVLIKQTASEVLSTESQGNTSDPGKNVATKAMSAISGFFAKKLESSKTLSETDPTKEKNNPLETFWRWGEEVIKPGFDLKTKIISLLDEQFTNGKPEKTADSISMCSKKSSKLKTDKSETTKAKSFKNSTTSPVNMLNPPTTVQDNKVSDKLAPSKNDEKSTIQSSSSQTFKNMLHLMSEKIYNDHVKPTVEAIKQEQKTFNNENTKQMFNIKAAMDAALCKVATKDTAPSNGSCKNEPLPSTTRKEWRKDFLEPLEIPASIKRIARDRDSSESSKLTKKSGIPVRVPNPSPAECVTNSKFKEDKQSMIPRWKLPPKTCSAKPEEVRKGQKVENKEDFKKKTAFKKLHTRNQHTANHLKSSKHSKPIHVKYMNPNAGAWNEESCASFLELSSEEVGQGMLTNSNRSFHKYENFRDNSRHEKRRISQKHSVTDKIQFLTNISKAEMGKAHVWNNILKQAKNHCRSKQDTVIIQIPTKSSSKTNVHGTTEVEFTVKDIQKLVNNSKLANSLDAIPPKSTGNGDVESFLIIKSRKILQNVHKHLESKFFKI